jgi:hypothetical protein
VRFPDVPGPLWLPRDVNVYVKVNDLSTIPDLGNPGQSYTPPAMLRRRCSHFAGAVARSRLCDSPTSHLFSPENAGGFAPNNPHPR